MTKEEFVSAVGQLNIWRKGEEEAPHKPLMLLIALCRVLKKNRQMIKFKEIEGSLTRLLKLFGPERSHYHPEYPYWRLQTSGFWKIENGDLVEPRKSNTDPTPGQLIEKSVRAGFSDNVFCMLAGDDAFVIEIIDKILDMHFDLEQRTSVLLEVLSVS